MNELDFIQSVKIQGEGGYLLNGTMSVPKVDGNREYELIKLWLKDGNIPEPELTKEELLKQEYQTKLSAINTEYDLAIANLSRGVPDTERSTWTKQEQEAKEVIAGNTNVPMLSALATARGIPLEYLASKVIEKANLYAMIVGELTGNRQKEEDTLKLEYKDIL